LWKRFFKITGLYWLLEKKWQAWSMLALLILMMAAYTKLTETYVNFSKVVFDALEKMDLQACYQGLPLLVCAIAASVILEVGKNYVDKSLNINWRLWLTTTVLGKYFANRSYYHINDDRDLDNPDQRISEGIKDYTDKSINYLTTITQSLFNLCIFSVALFKLSPKLLLVVLIYAGFSGIVTKFLSKRLVSLNFRVQQRCADFRHSMVHVRDNTESIAFFRGESREKNNLVQRLGDYIRCQLTLNRWQFNLGCFTGVLIALPQLLPLLILAPGYFAGKITLGDITKGTIAFTWVLYALNAIIGKISELTGLVASFTRVETLMAALDQTSNIHRTAESPVISSQEDSGIAMENVTLLTPDYGRTLIKNVTASLLPGKGMLIVGKSGTGKSSLLRSIAGLWNAGEGQITRPPLGEMFFLPQRPYMIHGTLREQMLYPACHSTVSDDALNTVLSKVNLADLGKRFGGFDIAMDWAQLLSLGEQQRLSFARLLLANPRYAILDEATSALDISNEASLYGQFQESGMTYVSVGHRPSLVAYHDNVLELQGDTNWRLVPAVGFQIAAET
jgi:putative ATP-binding cassette transporter